MSAMEAEAAAKAGEQMIISPQTGNAGAHQPRGKRRWGTCASRRLYPYEIVRAHSAGADFVKLFPPGNGALVNKAVSAPLCHIPLLGRWAREAREYFKLLDAGMAGFGVGARLRMPPPSQV
jgi:2-dehydro-3-deoxyphosphogluconate aldolase/(4S)-4-hydroxy-2-oxoglutarate aldolase